MKTEVDVLVPKDIYDSSSICRICLTQNIVNALSLFEMFNNTLLSEKLIMCGRVDVQKEDGLPAVICEECYKELDAADMFRIKCQTSDDILRKMYIDKKPSEIALEIKSMEQDMELINEDNKDDIAPKTEEEPIDVYFSDNYKDDDSVTSSHEVIKQAKSRKGKRKKKIIESNEKVFCPKCSKPVSSKYGLEQHMEKMHCESRESELATITGFGANRRFLCKICGYIAKRKQSFQYHVYTHTGEKPFHCDICNKNFTQHSSLMLHKRNHSDKTYFSCEYCGKQSNNRTKYLTHKRVHDTEKKFKCDICGKGCKTKGTLISHMNRHYNIKNYSCDVCGSTFVSKCELTNHSVVHKNVFHFCTVCNFKTRTKRGLKDHMFRHTGNHPFQCDFCEWAFCTRFELVSHIKTHTKVKNYSCPACNDKFAHRSGANKHMLRKHGIKFSRNDIDRRIVK